MCDRPVMGVVAVGVADGSAGMRQGIAPREGMASGRPRSTARRIRWITRGYVGKISLRRRAARAQWGAARPRPILAVPAMWNYPETPHRRRPQFDSLEGRQLLHGGPGMGSFPGTVYHP